MKKGEAESPKVTSATNLGEPPWTDSRNPVPEEYGAHLGALSSQKNSLRRSPPQPEPLLGPSIQAKQEPLPPPPPATQLQAGAAEDRGS